MNLTQSIKNCRNPLKSGQCFLQLRKKIKECLASLGVAIPSNRVNVSYFEEINLPDVEHEAMPSRNPLKSGQCFLRGHALDVRKAK